MEKPIQAGMILKTKFVAAGNDKFTEYINYICLLYTSDAADEL